MHLQAHMTYISMKSSALTMTETKFPNGIYHKNLLDASSFQRLERKADKQFIAHWKESFGRACKRYLSIRATKFEISRTNERAVQLQTETDSDLCRGLRHQMDIKWKPLSRWQSFRYRRTQGKDCMKMIVSSVWCEGMQSKRLDEARAQFRRHTSGI